MPLSDDSGDALVTRVAVALYGKANGWGHLDADRYWPGESEGTHLSYKNEARKIIAEPTS